MEMFNKYKDNFASKNVCSIRWHFMHVVLYSTYSGERRENCIIFGQLRHNHIPSNDTEIQCQHFRK